MDESFYYGILGIGTHKQLYTRNGLNDSWVKAPDKGGQVTGVAIMHDGTILAIGTDQKLYTRANLDASWVKAPDKGGLVTGITIMSDCTILAIGTDKKLYTRKNLNSSWVKAPDKGGQVNAVTMMKNGEILGVGTDLKLYCRATLNDSWVKAPDKGGQVRDVTIMPDGSILAIGTDQKLYTRTDLNASWVKAPDKGGLVIGISVAPVPKMTITVSATEEHPFPPGLSDGLMSTPPGGNEQTDIDFTTPVSCGQVVQFVSSGEISSMSIVEGEGDFFRVDPSAENNWTGLVGSMAPDVKHEYTIHYAVNGVQQPPQDPQLQMKR